MQRCREAARGERGAVRVGPVVGGRGAGDGGAHGVLQSLLCRLDVSVSTPASTTTISIRLRPQVTGQNRNS